MRVQNHLFLVIVVNRDNLIQAMGVELPHFQVLPDQLSPKPGAHLGLGCFVDLHVLQSVVELHNRRHDGDQHRYQNRST